MSKHDFVITHKNCIDGALAAAIMVIKKNIPLENVFELGHCNGDWMAENKYLKSLGFFDKLDQIENEHITVYVTDHGLQAINSSRLLIRYQHLRIINIDHHATNLDAHNTEEYNYLVGNSRYRTFFSNRYSGAGLAWIYCTMGSDQEILDDADFNGVDLLGVPFESNTPPIVHYVQDGDIWTWKYRRSSEPFTTALRAHCKSASDIIEMFGDELIRCPDDVSNNEFKIYKEYITAGIAIMTYRQSLIDSAKKGVEKIAVNIDGVKHNGLLVNTHLALSSHLLNQLVDENDNVKFAIAWCREGGDKYLSSEYQFSLRSGNDFDCSVIAKHFGGGGHKQACGFKVINNDDRATAIFHDLLDGKITINTK